MTRARWARAVVLAPWVVVVAGPGVARSDQILNCDAYAAKAVEQQRRNLSMACGLAGGAWSADHAGHRAWCRQASVRMADLTREDGARESALDQCVQRDAACGQYALLARQQNTENAERRCGLAGRRWSDDVNGHRAWCMSVDLDAALAETEARQAALAGCDCSLAGDAESPKRPALRADEVEQVDPLRSAKRLEGLDALPPLRDGSGVEQGQRVPADEIKGLEAAQRRARCQRQLARSQFQDVDQKAQQYLDLLRNVLKTLHDTQQGILRKAL